MAFILAAVGCDDGRVQRQPGAGAGAVRETAGTNLLTGENVDIPQPVRSASTKISFEQSKGLDGAKVAVRRAYISPADSFRLKPEYRDLLNVVIVDVIFENYRDWFDLDDVDLINPDANEDYGSDPDLYGVLPDDQICAIDDPEARSRERYRHVLLVYSPPKTCRVIELYYWGKRVTSGPITLEDTGPALPKGQTLESCTIWPAGRATEVFDRYFACAVFRDSFRNDRFSSPCKLICANEPCGAADRLLEIDEAGQPCGPGAGHRPAVMPQRRLLIEFWVQHAKEPEFMQYGYGFSHSDVRLTEGQIKIPASTLAALGQQPIHSWAEHRSAEERFGKANRGGN